MKTALQEKLAFVAELRAFGQSELGLVFDGSFEHYSAKHTTCNWLYVCQPDRLVSSLPGEAPFEFFWDTHKARRRQQNYERQGMYTYLYQAEAHGGHACPITPALLEASHARQAYVVLHEGWHATLRLQNYAMPYTLEESSGRAVGLEGAKLFARHIHDNTLYSESCRQMEAWRLFAGFVNTTWRSLSRFYNTPRSDEELKLQAEQITSTARALSAGMPYSWEREELNRHITPAFILRNHDYTWYYPLCLKVLNKCGGLKRAMRKYKAAAENGAPTVLKEFVKKSTSSAR